MLTTSNKRMDDVMIEPAPFPEPEPMPPVLDEIYGYVEILDSQDT